MPLVQYEIGIASYFAIGFVFGVRITIWWLFRR
jgi:hypothetical protein